LISSGNDYIAALKGNQPNLFKMLKPTASSLTTTGKQGTVEPLKRSVSIYLLLDGMRLAWAENLI